MSEIQKYKSSELIKFDNGHTSELISYTDREVVLNSNKIEVYRLNKGIDECIKMLSGYILQANLLLAENQRMPVNQIMPVCKKLLDGPAWNLSFEEFSNIINGGITGCYGKVFRLDLPTIGEWVNSYNEKERKEIFTNKELYRDQKKSQELNTMSDNHIKLFKSILKE